ncbi:MAG: hypothetical protein ABL993_15610 [Vicinamibacterales bacterium]
MRRFSGWLQSGIAACGALLIWAAPAAAQVDIVGVWQQPGNGVVTRGGQYEDMWERCCGGGAGRGGPAAADFIGIPLNEAGRARAMAHDDSLWSAPEHQCQPHAAAYAYWGVGAPHIEAVFNDSQQMVAYHIAGTYRRLPREIWMDGRPHPPEYERHTWAGFTTGEWKGNTLVAKTTHLKKGWVRRNGAPASDQATLWTYFSRHGDVLTVTVFVDDPLYFSEPYVKSTDYRLAASIPTARFDEAGSVSAGAEASGGDQPYFRCYGTEEVIFPEEHWVSHWLPGENPSVGERAKRLHIPIEATLGYAVSAYPEYIGQIKTWREQNPAEPLKTPVDTRKTAPAQRGPSGGQ